MPIITATLYAEPKGLQVGELIGLNSEFRANPGNLKRSFLKLKLSFKGIGL